jgi:hypothetical protein
MSRSWCVGSALVLSAQVTNATPHLSVFVEGNCPNQRTFVSILTERGFEISAEAASAEFRVHVNSEPGHSTLSVYRKNDQEVLTRRLTSRDCRAMAEAMVVVLEAHFISMNAPPTGKHTPPERNPPEPTSPPAERAPASVEHTTKARQPTDTATPTLEPSTAPSTLEPPTLEPSTLEPSTAPSTLEPSTAPPTLEPSTAPSQTPKSQTISPPLPTFARNSTAPTNPQLAAQKTGFAARGYVALGPVVELPERRVSPRFELGFGGDFTALPLSLELVLASHFPTTVGETPNRVKRWDSQGLLRVGLPSQIPSVMSFRPWFGGGVARNRLKALDLAVSSTVSSYAPTLSAGFEVALPLGSRIALLQNTICTVYLRRDSYQVNPDGIIGRGPRVSCGMTLGLGLFFSRANERSTEKR